MKKPFFDSLRTKQQTGYLVWNQSRHQENQLYSWFGVQSATHDPRDLLARYELFIEDFLRDIGQTEAAKETFESVKASMLTKLRMPPDNLKQLTQTYISIAFDRDADFNWIEKRIKSFEDLTYEEYVEIAPKIMGRENKKRLGILVSEPVSEAPFRYEPIDYMWQFPSRGIFHSKDDKCLKD